MTLTCKLCKYSIRSAKPDVWAAPDVLKKLSQHLGAAHREHAEQLASLLVTVQQLAATYLLFSFADIPENESSLHDAYAENKEALFNILQSSVPTADLMPASGGPLN